MIEFGIGKTELVLILLFLIVKILFWVGCIWLLLRIFKKR